MDLSNVVGHLVLSTIFIVSGIGILVRQNARIGVGGGRTAGSPLFVAEVQGLVAKILGSSLVISGFLIGLPFLLTIFGNDVSSSIAFWSPFIGIVFGGLGLLFSFIIQSAVSLGENLQTQDNKPDEIDNGKSS